MKLTERHLKNIQIELFYTQLNAIDKEQKELVNHNNDYYGPKERNLACSEWKYGSIPSVSGGKDGLKITKMIPNKTELLKNNFELLSEEISYRRYALIETYYPIIRERIGKSLADCLDYWRNKKEITSNSNER